MFVKPVVYPHRGNNNTNNKAEPQRFLPRGGGDPVHVHTLDSNEVIRRGHRYFDQMLHTAN